MKLRDYLFEQWSTKMLENKHELSEIWGIKFRDDWGMANTLKK